MHLSIHSRPVMFERWPRPREVDELEREISTLAAHIHAATFRLLTLIAEFDRRDGWVGAGLLSCAHWLNWKCGIGLNAAREKLRVAHALAALPLISREFEGGRVSFSKVRAMTRVATPENEEYLLMIARHGTAAHVEKLVRSYRGLQRREEAKRAQSQHAERSLRWFHDDDGSYVLQVRLPPERGALVTAALEAQREQLRSECHGDAERESLSALRADALVTMAETTLASEGASAGGGDRHQVVVHVDAAVLHDPQAEGRCELEDGPALACETVRRLACDAAVVRITDDANGTPLDVGRKTRSIPPALRRALKARDSGCRFPGCTHSQFLDAHHVKHWADGGATSLANTVLLCRRHHRFVHEGDVQIQRLDDGALRFVRRDGRAIPATGDITAVTSASTASLMAANQAAGLDIGPDTGRSCWDGSPMDLVLAVEGLVRRGEGL